MCWEYVCVYKYVRTASWDSYRGCKQLAQRSRRGGLSLWWTLALIHPSSLALKAFSPSCCFWSDPAMSHVLPNVVTKKNNKKRIFPCFVFCCCSNSHKAQKPVSRQLCLVALSCSVTHCTLQSHTARCIHFFGVQEMLYLQQVLLAMEKLCSWLPHPSLCWFWVSANDTDRSQYFTTPKGSGFLLWGLLIESNVPTWQQVSDKGESVGIMGFVLLPLSQFNGTDLMPNH